MTKKSSIRGKINNLIVVSIIVLSAFMIGVNVIITNRYAELNADTLINKTGQAQKLRLDNQFELVEQAVHDIYDISEAIRPSIGDLDTVKKADLFVKQFENLAIKISQNAGALAVYYRMNPELNGNGSQGFFYVLNPVSQNLEPSYITDLYDYPEDDVEHVGWYYVPANAGRPVWMEPYYNANINTEMISYVIPIYEGDYLIGVIGMDVDFNQILDITEDVNIYESSGAALMSLENQKVYYETCDIFGEVVPEFMNDRVAEGHVDKSHTDRFNGTRYKTHFEELRNGMYMVIYAKASDVNTQRYTTIIVSGAIFIIALFVTLLWALSVSKRIIGPIEKITEAAKSYAEGDWDAEVTCDTNDELHVLTDNITIMAAKTKEYIGYVNNLAQQDALTKIKNKTAYMQYVMKVKTEYLPANKPFAIVVFDLNNLKYINDYYGHEKGDLLLMEGSKYICNTFSHSPVFRIGGDEFVAILDTTDYENREELFRGFCAHMMEPKNIDDPRDVCIAGGMAVYGEDGTDYDLIFDVADQRMYANKKVLKEKNGSK